jgi:Uncharacterised nucleotidyltransferase
MNEDKELPLREPLRYTLRKITERLAAELAAPTPVIPDWSPTEWQLARAVAAIHCVSPLLAGSLRWQGPAVWTDFLADQKVQVTARHRQLQTLLERINVGSREEDIPLVGLKGVALHSLGLYRPGERPMADIDLLVHCGHAIRTAHVLESLGFTETSTNWKHGVFEPAVRTLHAGIGEHADNYLKIELHVQIAEKLPSRLTEVTDCVYPRMPHPGLNAYPSNAALMTHLLLHAAGSMAYRALRLLHLHDIALLSGRMTGSDWDELGAGDRKWWALPPLQLTSRYYADAVPAEVLAKLARDCPWTLRQLARRQNLSDVSLSYPWVEAFPGIGWSQSITEIIEHIQRRVWPDAEMRRLRQTRMEHDHVASETQWCGLSQRQRMLRWLTSRPLRVETLHAVRLALTTAH